MRENTFLKAKKEIDKIERKRLQQESDMDVTPAVRVAKVIDKRLKDLGLIEQNPETGLNPGQERQALPDL